MSGRTKVLLVCAVSLGASILRLSAQEVGGDTITGKVHQIEKVTVTARRSPNKVTSAVPIQTMSRQDISQLGIQNMADAVRRFAGANVKDYGGIGGLKTVSIRNMGAAHTAVSYDGVAVSNCQAGQIDIGRFSLDNVSMLSLAIGQSEDLLQSARLYASAGVLGIETEKPHFDDGRNAAFQARVRGGSFGMVSPSLRWWQKLGCRTRVAVDAGYMRADGNYPFTLVNGKYVTEEKRNNSGIYSWQGEATLYHTFKDDSELDVKGYYFYSRRGLPGAVTLYNPLSDETLWDENTFVQARYRKHFSPRWSLQAQAKYNHGWNQYKDEGKEYADGYYRENHRQDEYYISATVLYRPLEALTLSLAQDGVINKLRNSLPECPFPTRYTSISAFKYNVGITWSKSGLSVFDYISVTLDGYYNDVTDKIVAFPTTYAWKMANYGKVHAAGVDATLAATVPLTKKIKLVMSGGYTWQKAIDLTDADAKNYKDQLPYTPLHSGNASAIVETPWVNVGYSVVGVGKRYYLSQNLPENEIEGYWEHTMSLSHEFALGSCRLRLQAEIINLTDEQYDVIKYYPMPGRSWRLTGTFKF